MCGILGIIGDLDAGFEIKTLLNSIGHRGPDDWGWLSFANEKVEIGKDQKVINGDVLLGHVRLSIIDLSDSGWQPMSSKDRRHHLVFNGEIYNYIELRAELQRLGIKFETSSDTEVLLAVMITWGISGISKLRGMFSFCYFDVECKKLLLVRDYFGIKPLFFCKTKNGYAFASEQSPLLQLAGVSKNVNPQGLYDYLISGATDRSVDTILSDIKQVPGAHYLQINLDNLYEHVSPQRYWKIDLSNKSNDHFVDAVRRVRSLFLESIELHLRSDVAIGAALSGGIDSSAIVCAIRHINPKQDIHSFSFIADEKKISEEYWVDIVNEHVQAIPHKVRATKYEMISDLSDLIKAQGEPFGSTSIYAQYRVFKAAAAAGIKVMLDGQGADELLGGYVFYQGSRLASLIKKGKLADALSFISSSSKWPDRSKRQLLTYAIRDLLPKRYHLLARAFLSKKTPPSWISKEWLKDKKIRIRGSEDLSKSRQIKDRLRWSLLDSLERSSIPHLLRYEDRNSMRFSIESRVPFMHVELAEYILSLPEHYLISSNGKSKHVFREAMRGIVPDVILDRRDKIGFATPEKSWLVGMDGWVKSRLNEASDMEFFDYSQLVHEWNEIINSRRPFDLHCWRWLNAIEWIMQLNNHSDMERV